MEEAELIRIHEKLEFQGHQHLVSEINQVIEHLDHCRVWTICAGSKHITTQEYYKEIRAILVKMRDDHEKMMAYDI